VRAADKTPIGMRVAFVVLAALMVVAAIDGVRFMVNVLGDWW